MKSVPDIPKEILDASSRGKLVVFVGTAINFTKVRVNWDIAGVSPREIGQMVNKTKWACFIVADEMFLKT